MTSTKQFSIGHLAREAQIPVTTVRYYERTGLLLPDDRKPTCQIENANRKTVV